MIKFIGNELTEYQKSVQDTWDKLSNSDSVKITSSGTTGKPKEFSIRDPLKRKKGLTRTGLIWLFSYQPQTWAGVSLLSHAIHVSDGILIPKSLLNEDLISAVKDATAISLTPTRFKNLWWSDAKLQHLLQITFGGEFATQYILNLAHEVAPRAKITHCYASAELGDVASCSDGKEGFPVEKFKDFIFTQDGELVIGKHKTGDLWNLVDNRYIFVGRDSNIANIGGNKVSIETIEQVVCSMKGVKSARCKILNGQITGQAVKLEYIGTTTPKEIRHTILRSLPKYYVPAIVELVEQITINESGKIKR